MIETMCLVGLSLATVIVGFSFWGHFKVRKQGPLLAWELFVPFIYCAGILFMIGSKCADIFVECNDDKPNHPTI